MGRTRPNYLNLFSFFAGDWTLVTITLRLAFVLLMNFSHNILRILRRQRWLNTESPYTSALIGHVSGMYINTHLTVAVYTQPLVDKRMGRRRRKYLILVNANRAFRIRKTVHLLFDHLLRYSNPSSLVYSFHPAAFLKESGSAFEDSSLATTFWRCKTHPTHICTIVQKIE